MLSIASFSFVASAKKSTSTLSAASSASSAYISEASQRFGVPEHWIRAVLQLESNGDANVVSPKGAIGLMQIMPKTFAELRLRYHLDANPYRPHSNILAGAAYLREMYDRYGSGGFLAAYNAGPGRYEDYLMRGRPLPAETHNYVTALASIIGVPTLPRQPEGTLVPLLSPTFVAAHNGGAPPTMVNENKFSPKVSQFENRPGTRTETLFVPIHVAFEQTLASARAVDMTALEPSPDRTLTAISASRERLPNRIPKAAQSSSEPKDNALFAVRLANSGKRHPQ